VTEAPKAVLEVAGWPFLRYQIESLRGVRCERIVFLTGHGADEVERRFGPRSPKRIFVADPTPLGTGGALANALAWAGERNLIANGDSYVDISPLDLLKVHHPGTGLIVAAWIEDRSDYGGLEIDPTGRIDRFLEKGIGGPGWINAGLYLLDNALLEEIGEGASSLERDHFPRWAAQGRLRAHRTKAFFRDIGTPERLEAAQQEFGAIRSRLEHGGPAEPPR
jgi:NDP-sugar pyrophosphorylase family protein